MMIIGRFSIKVFDYHSMSYEMYENSHFMENSPVKNARKDCEGSEITMVISGKVRTLVRKYTNIVV